MMTKEGPTQIINLMTPRAGVLAKKKILPGIDQTNYVYSNDDQGRVYQNCKFHDPGEGVLKLGCGHISHFVKMHYSFFKIFFPPMHRSDKLSI